MAALQRSVQQTPLQQQARALGDPTRHAIYRFVAESAHPVGIAELTDHFGLNHNAIRQHLAKLVEAGLVVERVGASSGPGRPPLQYEADLSADSRWGIRGPYERLSLLLTEIIRTGDTPVEVGRRAGRALRASAPGDDPVEAMSVAMAKQGFEPDVRTHRSGADVVLRHCPFATAARDDRDTVCSLHLGIAEGLAEGTGAEVEELVAKDPRRANCRLRLHVTSDG
jgi:predicted ArsR family transcriptional regulator